MKNIPSEKTTSIMQVLGRCGYVGQSLSVKRERKYLTEHSRFSRGLGSLLARGQFENVLLVEVFRVGSIIVINLLSGTAKV